MAAKSVAYIVAAVVAVLLAVLLSRTLARRRRVEQMAQPVTEAPPVDLADENTGADRLPEDGWIALALELIARGDFRLAMRAYYFASLAHLAARQLIGLGRYKSNRDYEMELRRRSHALPEVLSLFRANLSLFEGIWYGDHEATAETVQAFAAGVIKIKAAA